MIDEAGGCLVEECSAAELVSEAVEGFSRGKLPGSDTAPSSTSPGPAMAWP